LQVRIVVRILRDELLAGAPSSLACQERNRRGSDATNEAALLEGGMQNDLESPLVAAQRSAIQHIRGRYERGEVPFDTFRDGLGAITQTQSPEQCAAIVRDLPHSPLATLAALEPPALVPSAPMPPAVPTARKRISAFMSETKKTRSGWSLAPDTHVRAVMGSVKLDLRRAQLPPQARLKINATMSEVVLYIPDDVAVSVRSTAIMGEVRALGESISGVIVSGEEEYIPGQVAPRARLVIEVSAVMGSVNVALVNPNTNTTTVAELARDALRAALEGMRRGWENGGQSATLPSPSARSGLPGASAD
jgi:hypothetical protein